MKNKTIFVITIIKYIYFFHLIITAFCFEIQWTYSQCKNILNELDIICHEIIKMEDGIEYCQKWNYIDFESIDFLPKECYNKIYNLNIIIADTNPPMKKQLNIKLENNEKTRYLDLNQNAFLISENEIPELKRCLNDYAKYKENCILNEGDDKNKKCNNELRINSPICNKLIKQFESHFESFNNGDLPKFIIDLDFLNEKNDNTNLDDNTFYISNEEKQEDDNYVYFEDSNIEEKSYFNYSKRKKKNDDDSEELENYYKNSRKDCVEYGLKSLKEDIIVCTKYE